MNIDAIPAELRERRQWVIWRGEVRTGKATKVPYRADGSGRASTTDASTWSTFEAARAGADALAADGVGFVFTAGDPFVGIDIDRLDANTSHIIRRLRSYTERSVSRHGVHVIVRASLAAHSRRRSGSVEVYERARYFVVTGEHMPGTPLAIEDRQAELDAVLAQLFPKVARSPSPSNPPCPFDHDDRELLDAMFAARNGARVAALWRGDTRGYPSHSEADAALVAHLAWWTGGDGARVDALFRRSGLMREKWDARRGASTYGALTIARAIERARAAA